MNINRLVISLFCIAMLSGCNPSGYVSGILTFHGVPCQRDSDDYRVPPCQGPYSNFKLDIRIPTENKIVQSVTTDQNGKFVAKLPPGDYFIFTQDGISKEDMKKNAFSVVKKDTTQIDLSISTGIQ